MIRFSVIVINYNHAPFLRARLDSVLQQDYPHFELSIIDDASTDDSKEIIESYRSHPAVTAIYYNTINSGNAYGNWPKACELAKSDYVWIAESDDVAHPGFLATAAGMLAENSNAGLFYCNASVIDENGMIAREDFATRKNRMFTTGKWSRPYCEKGADEIKECLQYDCTVNNVSSMVFRKNLFADSVERIKTFRYYGDWMFIISLCEKADICYSNKTLNSYRAHSGSYLHRPTQLLREKKEHFQILQELYKRAAPADRKKLLDHFALHYLGAGIRKNGLRVSVRIFANYFKADFKLGTALLWRWFKLRVTKLENGFSGPEQ